MTDSTETPLIQACWLVYDIPQGATFTDPASEREYTNPSDLLRPIAFRANLSCWVIMEGDIPHMLLDNMREQAKARIHIVRFDASETPKLLAMAADAIERDIRATVQEANASYNRSVERFHENDNSDKAQKRFDQDTKRILKVAGRNLKDLRSLATRFQIESRLPTLNTANIAVKTLQGKMVAQAKAFGAAVLAIEAQNGKGDAMAKAARMGQVPAGILADYAEEHGAEKEGKSLRDSFFGGLV